MTFLNPILAAVGLACVALPILIHILLRRRRRPVAWGAMKFLLEAYRRQRRRTRLEQLLLLASRCLLVALLALALGRPLLSRAASGLLRGPRTLYLVIDTSLTASAGSDEPAIARLRQQAAQLVTDLDASRGDRAALLTLASPADGLVLPPTPDLAAVADLLKGLTPTDARADLPGAASLLRDELRRARDRGDSATPVVTLLSEWRAGSVDLATPLPSLDEPRLVLQAAAPATTALGNASIIALDPARSVFTAPPGAAGDEVVDVRARVGIRRSTTDGGGPARVILRVLGAGADSPPQAAADLTWAPGQSAQSVTLSVPVPARQAARGRVLLAASIDRDSVEGDNDFRRPLEVRERLDVGVIAPTGGEPPRSLVAFTPADWLSLALAPDAAGPTRRRQGADLRVTTMDPARAVTAGALADFAAVLLPRPDLLDESAWRALRAACDAGTLVVVFAPPLQTPHTWTDAMTSAMGLPGWTFAREPTSHEPPQRLAATRALPPERDLLGLVAPELADLGAPVRFSRTLAPSIAGTPAETVLALDDATPLLLATTPGDAATARGLFIYAGFAPDLAWTDLPTKPLMVPLLQELLRQGAGRAAGDSTALAGTLPRLPQGAVELAPLPAKGAPIRLDASGRPTPPVRTRGAYLVRSSSGAAIGAVAFNADPAAGDLATRDPSTLASWLAGLGATPTWIGPGSPGTSGQAGNDPKAGEGRRPDDTSPLSLPLLLGALALALVEAVLARRFSYADAARGGGTSPAPPLAPPSTSEVRAA